MLFGDRRLTDDEVVEVKAWLDKLAAAATAAAAAAARHRLRLPRRADALGADGPRARRPRRRRQLWREPRAQRRGDAAGGRRAECAARPERGGERQRERRRQQNYWANPDWYLGRHQSFAYFALRNDERVGYARAVDLGPNGNDITYNAYGNLKPASRVHPGPNARNPRFKRRASSWDMRLELQGSGPVGHTMAMGCWVKLRHGSNGLDTTPMSHGPALWRTATPQITGTFCGRGGAIDLRVAQRQLGPDRKCVRQKFGIGMESIGQDTTVASQSGRRRHSITSRLSPITRIREAAGKSANRRGPSRKPAW